MAKSHSKKRSKTTSSFTPRTDVAHDWQKDDEELDLESRLFGTSKKAKLAVNQDGENDLEGVDDDDLFTIDAPVVQGDEEEGEEPVSDIDDDEVHGGQDDDDEEEDEDEDDEDEEHDEDLEMDGDSDAESSGSSSSSTGEEGPGATDPNVEITFPADMVHLTPTEPRAKGKSRVCVWSDPADGAINVNLESDKRLRKLARGKGKGAEVTGSELEERLREQFERLHPRPSWVDKRAVIGTPSLSSLLSTTKSFIDATSTGAGSSRSALVPHTIKLQRLLNANHQNPTVGKRDSAGAGKGVVSLEWHPNKRVGVLAVAGGDRRVRFFNIDGHTNPTLLTLHLPSLPLTRTSFHPSGSSLLLTGTRPYYYTYDLPSSRCIRSPRNLFGSTPTLTSPNSLTRHAFSPNGSMLAVAGRRGAVSILDWSGIGVGAVIAELKSGRGGTVVDLTWRSDGKELSVLGGRDGCECEVWNVAERKVVRKWRDDRAYGGLIMGQSLDERYTAIGSSTGIVNLYSTSSLQSGDIDHDLTPSPLRSLEHLTTAINSLAFHPESELMVTASETRKAQLKLYHLGSGTAYSNWPTSTTPLGRVTTAKFNPGGEYLSVGNQRGNVLLYSVKHYANA